jgi:hypothetical protein
MSWSFLGAVDSEMAPPPAGQKAMLYRFQHVDGAERSVLGYLPDTAGPDEIADQAATLLQHVENGEI